MRFFRLFLILFFCSSLAEAQQTTVVSIGSITESVNIAYKIASSPAGTVTLTATGRITIYFGDRLHFDGNVDDLIIAGANSPQQKYDYIKGRFLASSTGSTGQLSDSTSTRYLIKVVNFPDSTKSRKSIQVENFPDSSKSRKQIEVLNFPDSTQSRKLVEVSNFPDTPVFGNAQPDGKDYTGFAVVQVENMLEVIVENMGSAPGIITFVGLQYSIQSGEQRKFYSRFDETKSKATPIGNLSVDGTGTVIRVIKIPSQ